MGVTAAGKLIRIGGQPLYEITFLRPGPNVFKIISRPLRIGFRIDRAHHGQPWGHPHLWRWGILSLLFLPDNVEADCSDIAADHPGGDAALVVCAECDTATADTNTEEEE